MKKITSLMLSLAVALNVMAIPAKPGQWVTLRLANGTTVQAQLRGDEFANFYQDAFGQRYDALGDGTFRAVTAEEVSAKGKMRRLVAARKQQERAENNLLRGKKLHKADLSGDMHNIVGTKHGIIILAEFPDATFSMDDPAGFYNKMANEKDFAEEGFRGSVRDYFSAQSRGQLDIEFDVVGPVMLPESFTYYGEGSDESNAPQMIRACVDSCALQLGVDFSRYDWDDDGEVDQIFVLYAGYGEATGGPLTRQGRNSDYIWPHMSVLDQRMGYGEWEWGEDLSVEHNGVKVNTYACSNELDASKVLMGIGTICHEYSHCMGFPDMYDTKYSGNYGMGNWDLMCAGSYNGTNNHGRGSSYKPAGYTAYERMVAGWLQPTELGEEDLTVANLMPLSEGGESYIVRNKGKETEYMLIENRAKTGWDEELGGEGLLITHVNWVRNAWLNNEVNSSGQFNPGHEFLTIVPADGVKSDGSTATDPFPTKSQKHFLGTSTQLLKLINQNTDGTYAIGINLKNITRDEETGAVSFDYESPNTANPNNANLPITRSEDWDDDVMFWETFDQCDSYGGNDDGNDKTTEWSGTAGMGAFLPDFNGWKNSNAQMGGGYQCAKFGTGSRLGDATTPMFTLNGTAELTFRAGGMEAAGVDSVAITLSGEGDMSFDKTEMKVQAGAWTDCKVTIAASGDVRITFTPENKTGRRRLFLDDVKVVKVSDELPTGIFTIAPGATASQPAAIYSLSGTYMGTQPNALPKGVYVRGGKKFVVR